MTYRSFPTNGLPSESMAVLKYMAPVHGYRPYDLGAIQRATPSDRDDEVAALLMTSKAPVPVR